MYPGSLREKVEFHPRVEGVHLSAEDWELFSDQAGAEEAARALNKALEQAVNEKRSAEEVIQHMESVMDAYAHLGARDSEPEYVLRHLVAEVYGKGRRA